MLQYTYTGTGYKTELNCNKKTAAEETLSSYDSFLVLPTFTLAAFIFMKHDRQYFVVCHLHAAAG